MECRCFAGSTELFMRSVQTAGLKHPKPGNLNSKGVISHGKSSQPADIGLFSGLYCHGGHFGHTPRLFGTGQRPSSGWTGPEYPDTEGCRQPRYDLRSQASSPGQPAEAVPGRRYACGAGCPGSGPPASGQVRLYCGPCP